MLLLLFIFCWPCHSMIRHLDTQVGEGHIWYTEITMYSEDSPLLGSRVFSNSSISVELSAKVAALHSAPKGKDPHIEVMITHEEDLVYVGVESSYGTLICCDHTMVEKGGCAKDQLGYAMLSGAALRHISYGLVSWDSLQPNPLESVSLRHDVSKSGLYYLLVCNCNGSHTGTVEFQGDLVFFNPYGYLEASQFPYIYLNAANGALSAVLLLCWLLLLHFRKQYLMMVHHGLTALLVLSTLQGVFSTVAVNTSNNSGSSCVPCIVFSVLSETLKGTLLRFMLLMMGIGITFDTMEIESRRHKFAAVGLTLAYALFAGTQTFVQALDSPSSLASSVAFNLKLALNIVNSLFYVWIFLELTKTLTRLRLDGELHKMKYFLQTLYMLIALAVVGLLLMLLETVVTWRNSQDISWSFFWGFSASWDIVFLALICVTALIWWPGADSAATAFSAQAQRGFDWDQAPRNVNNN